MVWSRPDLRFIRLAGMRHCGILADEIAQFRLASTTNFRVALANKGSELQDAFDLISRVKSALVIDTP